MTDQERHAEAARIRDLIVRINELQIDQLRNMATQAGMAALGAAQRYGEASVLHAVGEIDADALRAVREAWRDARDHVEAVRLIPGAVASIRARLSDELQSVMAPDRARDRAERMQKFTEAFESFRTEFTKIPEDAIIRRARELHEAASRVNKLPEVRDLFKSLRQQRLGALLKQFV